MTPDDITWPPPWCEACRDRQHQECRGWCECDCPWLYEED